MSEFSKILFELVHEPRNRDKVVDAICAAVEASFVDGSRRTRREEKRRASICIDWFEVLRGDLDWSCVKFCDALPSALRSKLDGTDFDPNVWGRAWAAPIPV